MRILAAHDVRCLDPRAEAYWCPCRSGIGLESAEGAVAYPGGIALEVRSQCVFQRPMMCGAWIRELRLIGVRAEVEKRA